MPEERKWAVSTDESVDEPKERELCVLAIGLVKSGLSLPLLPLLHLHLHPHLGLNLSVAELKSELECEVT